MQGPHIIIRNVKFTGAPPDQISALRDAAKALSRQEYLRSALRPLVDKELLPMFFSRGYLKSSFGPAQPAVVEESTEGALVDLTLPVDPGPQYKFAGTQWSGNKVFPAEKLDPLLTLQKGEPADGIKLEQDLEAVRHLLRNQGLHGSRD